MSKKSILRKAWKRTECWKRYCGIITQTELSLKRNWAKYGIEQITKTEMKVGNYGCIKLKKNWKLKF